MVELRQNADLLLDLIESISQLMLIDYLDGDLEVGIENTFAQEYFTERAGAEDLTLWGNLVVGFQELEATNPPSFPAD